MGKARQAEGGALSSSQSPKCGTHSERSAVGGAVKPGFFFFLPFPTATEVLSGWGQCPELRLLGHTAPY